MQGKSVYIKEASRGFEVIFSPFRYCSIAFEVEVSGANS